MSVNFVTLQLLHVFGLNSLVWSSSNLAFYQTLLNSNLKTSRWQCFYLRFFFKKKNYIFENFEFFFNDIVENVGWIWWFVIIVKRKNININTKTVMVKWGKFFRRCSISILFYRMVNQEILFFDDVDVRNFVIIYMTYYLSNW